jgi:hypothetical protein
MGAEPIHRCRGARGRVDYEWLVARRLFLRSGKDDEELAELDPEMGGDASRWSRATSWEDAYGLSLALLLLAMLLPVFIGPGELLTVLTGSITIVACLIALHSSNAKPWLLWATTILCFLGLAVGVLEDLFDSREMRAIAIATSGLLLFVTPVTVLARIARHKVITPRTLYGALTVYLLLALAFSFLYQAMDKSDQGSFPAISEEHDRGAYAYYSFITITTTGYGDIVPATASARSLATFEVVIGQVFLVVIVARVVSMLGHERLPSEHRLVRGIHREDGEPGDDPPT